MSLLKRVAELSAGVNDIEEAGDVLGGGFGPIVAGVYDATISMAYAKEADSGAIGVHFQFKLDNGNDYREAVYITSGKAKGCKNYYEKDGVKHYLPGYNIANAIALLSIGKEITDIDTETKTISVYNADAKAEVPTPSEVLVELLNQPIKLAILHNLEVKQTKVGSDYVDTDETRETNNIDKVFRSDDDMTVSEVRAGNTGKGIFVEAWAERNAGKVRDKTKGKGTGSTGGAPKASAPAATPKPKTSLFNKK